FPRAVGAAEHGPVALHPVAHNAASAVRTLRRYCVDCALEAVERVALSRRDHIKTLVVIVPADLALRHGSSLPFFLVRLRWLRAVTSSVRLLKFELGGSDHRMPLAVHSLELRFVGSRLELRYRESHSNRDHGIPWPHQLRQIHQTGIVHRF